MVIIRSLMDALILQQTVYLQI